MPLKNIISTAMFNTWFLCCFSPGPFDQILQYKTKCAVAADLNISTFIQTSLDPAYDTLPGEHQQPQTLQSTNWSRLKLQVLSRMQQQRQNNHRQHVVPGAFRTSYYNQCCQLYQYNQSKTCSYILTNTTAYTGFVMAENSHNSWDNHNCLKTVPSVRIGVINCVQDWKPVRLVLLHMSMTS